MVNNVRVVYLAGKMSGLPDLGFSAFDAARDALRERGYVVISPADISRAVMERYPHLRGDALIRKCYTDDVSAILNVADAVVMLPSWRESEGAQIEKRLAEYVKLPVFEYAELLERVA